MNILFHPFKMVTKPKALYTSSSNDEDAMGLLDRMNREETRLGRINRINRKGFLKDWGRWLGIGAASLPFAFNVFAGNNADLEARTANDDNATVTIHVSDKKNE